MQIFPSQPLQKAMQMRAQRSRRESDRGTRCDTRCEQHRKVEQELRRMQQQHRCQKLPQIVEDASACLLYTSDAADD